MCKYSIGGVLMLRMDYFASTSLSKLEKMIDAEKDATIRQKFLVVWHLCL
jgi:hypothetical protein